LPNPERHSIPGSLDDPDSPYSIEPHLSRSESLSFQQKVLGAIRSFFRIFRGNFKQG